MEWIEQQVVKRRIKRDYKPGGTQSMFFNDPKWQSMWYMVSSFGSNSSVSLLKSFVENKILCKNLSVCFYVKQQRLANLNI